MHTMPPLLFAPPTQTNRTQTLARVPNHIPSRAILECCYNYVGAIYCFNRCAHDSKIGVSFNQKCPNAKWENTGPYAYVMYTVHTNDNRMTHVKWEQRTLCLLHVTWSQRHSKESWEKHMIPYCTKSVENSGTKENNTGSKQTLPSHRM